jgi:hypothetical protein
MIGNGSDNISLLQKVSSRERPKKLVASTTPTWSIEQPPFLWILFLQYNLFVDATKNVAV